MIEPRRTATTVRWHALIATTAIVVGFAAILGGAEVLVPDPADPRTQRGWSAIHLGVAAAPWLLVAWLLVELRRRTPDPSRALLAAAGCAALAAGFAIAAELATTAGPSWAQSADWVALATLGYALAAAGWMIAACVGLGSIAARLARGTLHLPTVRARVRALHLVTLCFLAPWSLLISFCAVFLGAPEISLGALAIGVLLVLVMQLVLADLIAKSRELATAALRE